MLKCLFSPLQAQITLALMTLLMINLICPILFMGIRIIGATFNYAYMFIYLLCLNQLFYTIYLFIYITIKYHYHKVNFDVDSSTIHI